MKSGLIALFVFAGLLSAQTATTGQIEGIVSDPTGASLTKIAAYCNLFRDGGVPYGDYGERLTFLLLLKMGYERTRPPPARTHRDPAFPPFRVRRFGEARQSQPRHLLAQG